MLFTGDLAFCDSAIGETSRPNGRGPRESSLALLRIVACQKTIGFLALLPGRRHQQHMCLFAASFQGSPLQVQFRESDFCSSVSMANLAPQLGWIVFRRLRGNSRFRFLRAGVCIFGWSLVRRGQGNGCFFDRGLGSNCSDRGLVRLLDRAASNCQLIRRTN